MPIARSWNSLQDGGMPTGGIGAAQQQLWALGEEAAAAVRQAATLARRRGHLQVTPLHVACAIIMSSSSSSSSSAPGNGTAGGLFLLRAAFPLQLRLDAALERLPVRAPAPKTTTQVPLPLPLSNALVAALKRAEAAAQHRRSGKVAASVELERLAASILDDPNVDRAVRGVAGSQQDVVEKKKKKKLKADPIVELSSSSSEISGSSRRQTTAVVDQDGISLALNLSCCHNHSCPDQSSQAKQRTGRSAIVGDTVATTSLPPWLRHVNQDQYQPNLTRSASLRRPKFRELTVENLKITCDALESRVLPRHRDTVPGIASTMLRCRSGLMRRRRHLPASTATWLLFQGNDRRGKKAMALELARLVFGSYTEFASSDSDPRLKVMSSRRHARNNGTYARMRLLEAILENPHRVVFIDGVDNLDHESGAAVMNVISTGRITGRNGRNGGLEDTVVVISSDEVSSSSSPRVKRRRISSSGQQNSEESPRRFSLDLNAPAEDREYVAEEEEENLIDDDVDIMGIVDGVFLFD